jgi:histidyl-tRNA synthetase
VATLRREGFTVFVDYDLKSLKSLLRQADRLEADFTVIAGDDELQSGTLQVKAMKGEKSQTPVPLSGLVAYFQSAKSSR